MLVQQMSSLRSLQNKCIVLCHLDLVESAVWFEACCFGLVYHKTASWVLKRAWDIIQEDTADPQFLEEDSEESSPKKQKTDSSIFKNISEKFNPKEVTDHEIDSDLKDFINVTFREQTDLVKNIHMPGYRFAMVKTKVNQCIWRLLKPQTQTDDVKMQTIQNDMIKASINVAKLLNEAGQSLNADLLNLELGPFLFWDRPIN